MTSAKVSRELLAILGFLFVSVFAGWIVWTVFLSVPQSFNVDPYGTVWKDVGDFYKYEYGEAKDLASKFLTLVVGVLVFSLTFSEKIVDYGRASSFVRFLLKSAWAMFVLALLFGGAGLFFIANCLALVRYNGKSEMIGEFGGLTVCSLALAGYLFTVGLVALVATATLARAKAADQSEKALNDAAKALGEAIRSLVQSAVSARAADTPVMDVPERARSEIKLK